MSPDVEKLVLEDNFKQTRAITIMEKASSLNIELFADFIKKVEKSGLLNRKVEFLPSEKEIANRSKNNENFTRPELAVILSYGKMLCNKKLHDSSLLDQKYFTRYLVDYFPKIINQKFSAFLENNPLKKEIINTVVTNKIINHITAPILFSIEINSPRSFDDLISAYFITNELFDLESIWVEIEAFDSDKNISSEIQIELFSEVIKILRRGITWLLKNNKESFDIHDIIEEYRINVANLYKKLPDLFLGGAKERFLNKSNYYKTKGLNDELASSFSSLEFAISIFDIISIAKKINVDAEKLANLYFTIGAMLDIDWLRKVADSDISSGSYWELLSKQVIKDELYSKQRILVERIASESKDCDFNHWCNLNENNYKIFKNFVDDLKMQKVLDLSMIVVANKKLELLI
jgi:glutamate dehydrogenase